MKLGLILSNDWELFGDGSGDFYEIQYKPTEALLKTCEEHGAKLTLMAEVGQQWAHRELGDKEAWALEISQAWEYQLKDVIRRKHDVQLHLHPQWLNATFRDNRWLLDYNEWAISALSPDRQEEYLKEGKQYLDKLLMSVVPDYSCIGFRAGGYCIEPSQTVIQSLLKAGIVCDTSVTKGLFEPGDYDYRDAYSNYLPWFVSNSSVKYIGDTNSGLLEIPIHSVPIIDSAIFRQLVGGSLIYKYNFGLTLPKSEDMWIKAKRKEVAKRYPLLQRPFMKSRIKSVRWLMSKIITKQALQLDYDYVPASIFVRVLQLLAEKVEMSTKSDNEQVIPVMSSGHVKGMLDCENINLILEKTKSELGAKMIFWTLSDAVKYWINRYKGAGNG
jgi:hypothetical protein